MTEREILDQKVLEQQGSFRRVKYWARGKHLGGKIISPENTWSGDWETEFTETQIMPIKTFRVVNDNDSFNNRDNR